MRVLSFARDLFNLRRGKAILPRFLTFTLTFSCNARCIMCDSWRKPSPMDLGLEEIDAIFEQLPRMDAVRLTGGEPFVRKDLPEIAELVRKKLKPRFLHITTNGFLGERVLRFCEKRHKGIPLFLLVSVDGMEDKHNQVRGTRKAWSQVCRTLETLAPRQKELRLNLAVNQTVVDAEGAKQYPELGAYLKSLGIRHQMVMAYDESATYSVRATSNKAPSHTGEFHTFGDFSRPQLETLLNDVEKDLQQLNWAERWAKSYYLRGIRNRLLNGFGDPNPRCVALNSHLRLFPNGQVPTCQFNTKSVGDLRKQSFREIWFGEMADTQRKWVARCPGCWAECEVLPNAIYTGDLFKKLPSRGKPREVAKHSLPGKAGV